MSQDRSKLYGVNVDWTTGNPGVVSADVVKLTARQVVVSRSLNALGYKTTIRLIDGEPEKGAWTPEGAAKRYRDDCAEAVTKAKRALDEANLNAVEAFLLLQQLRGEA